MRSLSNNLLAQIYNQNSDDPLLMLVTLSHDSFSPIYLVNNRENITSRGNEYTAFPLEIKLPTDDGQTAQKAQIQFDNISLELIDEIRTVTNAIDCQIEVILASDPDTVEISYDEFKIQNVSYNDTTITADLVLDDFLNTEISSERYTPSIYPGLFT